MLNYPLQNIHPSQRHQFFAYKKIEVLCYALFYFTLTELYIQRILNVREILDFSGRCLGVGTRYEMLVELSRREREASIKPDPEIDAFMKATSMSGQKTSLITDYVLKVCSRIFCICLYEHSIVYEA